MIGAPPNEGSSSVAQGRTRPLALWQAGVLASFAVCAIVPIFGASPFADVSGWYTDHLHHAFATWLFLFKGTALYTQPFAELWSNSGYPHPSYTWGQMPMLYPPGVFAIFLPVTLVGRFVPLEPRAYAGVVALYLNGLAHLSLWATWSALRRLAPGGRFLVGGLAWLVIVPLGLEGFFDAVYVGLGALMVVAVAERKPQRALVFFVLAMLTHYRAAVLTPLALAALWDLVKGRAPRDWPWALFALLAAMAVVFLGSFALAYPATAEFRATHASGLLTEPKRLGLAVVATALLVAALLAWGDPLTALVALLGLCLGALDVQNYWWHGAMLLVVPLAVGARSAAPAIERARAAAVLWFIVLVPLIWRDPVTFVFNEFVVRFRLG